MVHACCRPTHVKINAFVKFISMGPVLRTDCGPTRIMNAIFSLTDGRTDTRGLVKRVRAPSIGPTRKIEEFVCPPNISETVAVRTTKLAHRLYVLPRQRSN